MLNKFLLILVLIGCSSLRTLYKREMFSNHINVKQEKSDYSEKDIEEYIQLEIKRIIENKVGLGLDQTIGALSYSLRDKKDVFVMYDKKSLWGMGN